ncbi:MAG: ABC transporter permease subunit [Deltaproteobacteria bacterium]|nr:ABC transporter permease subunit [Deltaproteobacteria bacterium]
MSSIWVIAKREIKSLFISPAAYIVLGIFALLSGVQFLLSLERFDQTLQQAKIQAQLMKNPEALSFINLNGMLISNVIAFGYFLILFTIPAVTMKLLCEERNNGTHELLLTSPISAWDIVLGKFLAGIVFFLAMVATNALFLIVMFKYGNPEPGPVLAGYLGLIFGGISFISIGLFASALTKNHIISFFTSLFISLVLLMIGWAAGSTSGHLSEFLQQASITTHFETFNKGLITVSSIVYFVTLWIFFLSATRVAVQSMARN